MDNARTPLLLRTSRPWPHGRVVSFVAAAFDRVPGRVLASEQTFVAPPLLIDRVWQRIFWAAFPLARLYWRLTHKKRHSALVAVHVGRELILLRSSYRRPLNFPGGQVRYGETPEAAAKRELMEEIGLCVGADLSYAGSTVDRVHFFELRLGELPRLRLDNREIVGLQLVSPEGLRELEVTKAVRAYLDGNVHQLARINDTLGDDSRGGRTPAERIPGRS